MLNNDSGRPGNAADKAAALTERLAGWLSENVVGRISRADPRQRLDYVIAVLSGALSLGALSVSLTYCLVTAFGLPMDSSAGTAVALFCAAELMTLPCNLPIKPHRAVIIDLIPLAAALLLNARKVLYSASTALAVITGAYGRVMGTKPVITEWSEKGVSCDAAVLALGLLIAYIWLPNSVYGRMTGIDIVILALTLAPCLVLEDHIPSRWAIVVLAVSLCCMLLPRAVKQNSAEAGGRTFMLLIVPIILLCLLPALIRPPQNYRPSPKFEQSVDDIKKKLEELFDPDSAESLTEKVSDLTGIGFSADENTDEQDLSKAGPRRPQNRTVMYIYPTASGTVYLKGTTMAGYDGGTWRALDASARYESGTWMSPSSSDITDERLRKGALYMDVNPYKWLGSVGLGTERNHIFVRTVKPVNVLFYPYFANESLLELCGSNASYLETSIPNTERTDSYNCAYRQAELSMVSGMAAGGYVGDVYLGNTTFSFAGEGTDENGSDMIIVDPNAGLNDAYSAFVDENYKDVPADIYDRLREIAVENGLLNLPKAQRPEAVAEYVRGIGRYDLNTPAVPKGEDFTLWFLENSHRGYCIHFATAAALLLRVCDIPSRYITGYMTYAEAGEWNTVTGDDAHAWVEYYDPMIGWIPLEVTASSAQAETSAVTMTTNTSTTATTAAPTSPSTAPTEVSSSDREEQTPVTVSGTDGGQPSGTDGGGQDQQSGGGRKHSPWLLLLIIPAAAGALYLRKYLEDRRRQALYSGGGNNCAAQLWTECEALMKLLGQKPDAQALGIARKAAFSSHDVTDSEISRVRDFRDRLVKKRTGAVSAPMRLIDRYIRLLY